MRVRVHLFARYREATGLGQVDLELPEDGTVESAWSAVVDRHPQLAQYRPFTLFAVGHDYVESDHRLKPGDELTVIALAARDGSNSGLAQELKMADGRDFKLLADAPDAPASR